MISGISSGEPPVSTTARGRGDRRREEAWSRGPAAGRTASAGAVRKVRTPADLHGVSWARPLRRTPLPEVPRPEAYRNRDGVWDGVVPERRARQSSRRPHDLPRTRGATG